MATVGCPSINFSFKCFSCFSALSGLSGLLGGCLKHRKPSDIASQSLSQSTLGDYGSGGVENCTTSPIPTLLVPGSFVMPIQDPENQNPEPITIKSESVDLSHVDLSHNEFENISQSLTAYNAPVRINGDNDGQAIEIQSIFNNPVQNTGDEEMSELAKSHMDKFSELMLSGEANVGDCEAKLLTPMRQVDELFLYDNQVSATATATATIYTSIDQNNFLAKCVVLEMPTPYEEVDLYQKSDVSSIHSPLPKVLQVNPVNVNLQPFVQKTSSEQDSSLKSSGEFPVYEDSDCNMLSGAKSGYGSDDWGGGKSRAGSIRRANKDTDQTPKEISNKELAEFKSAYKQGQANQPKNEISSSKSGNVDWSEMFSLENLEKFFGNSSENDSPLSFFENLSKFVVKIKENVVPSPAPASASVKSDNENSKGKY